MELTLRQAQSYGRFGIHSMGAHTIFKLRYTLSQANSFLDNPIAKKYKNDINTFYPVKFTKQGNKTVWIIACVGSNTQACNDLVKLNLLVRADKLIKKAEDIYSQVQAMHSYSEQQEFTYDYDKILDEL
jgi:hypothetical protein